MPIRPLPPVIGGTELALRRLLADALAASPIAGYDQWIYLNLHGRADDPAQLDELVSDALGQPAEVAAGIRGDLVEAGVLDAGGSMTEAGRQVLRHCREVVAGITEALVAGIDDAALEVTVATLETVRRRAGALLAG